MCKYLACNGLCASDSSDAHKNGAAFCLYYRGTSEDMCSCPVYVAWIRSVFDGSDEFYVDDVGNIAPIPF